MRDSFIFYRSFQNAIDACSKDEQLILYKAIANYALDRVEPDLTGVAKVCWVLIKPQLDANWKRYENGCKGANYGRMGGAPRGNKNALKTETTPKQPQNNPTAVEKTTPNVNDNDNDNVNDNVNIKKKKKKSETIRFTPPTLEQIIKFINEKRYNVDPERFFNFYESKGWMVGKNKMKSWRAAVANWNSREHEKETPSPKLDFEKTGRDPEEGYKTTI